MGRYNYSDEPKAVSKLKIKAMVTPSRISSIQNKTEAEVIQKALITRRGGDGKISLRQIYQTMIGLKGKKIGDSDKSVSDYDVKGVVLAFEKYYESKKSK